MKKIPIPEEAINLLINTLIQYPYREVAPVLEQYNKIIEEEKKDEEK